MSTATPCLGKADQPYAAAEEQYSELPRALCDEDGNPHTGNKSVWTDKLSIQVFLTHYQYHQKSLS